MKKNIEMELFEYFEYLKSNINEIDGIPLDELYDTLIGKETKYKMVTDSMYYMVFKNKETGEVTSLECVSNYYNLEKDLAKKKCRDKKSNFTERRINQKCIDSNCAKCHVCCIEDFYNNIITKK